LFRPHAIRGVAIAAWGEWHGWIDRLLPRHVEKNGTLPGDQGVVIDPSGTVIANIAMAATCAPCTSPANYTGGGYTVFKASTTGTYNILLQEVGQTTGPNDYGPLWNSVTWQITSP
jgi:hypothetical protein